MYEAIREGQVDVISAYTTDARIREYNLALLEDPSGGLPPYDAMLLLSPLAAENPEVVAALQTLVGAIDNATMLEANSRVSLDGASIAMAAEELAKKLGVGE
jgi:osmoprotectant transport system permease protein